MREAKGIKQETIAHLTNISPGHANRIESGQKRATRSFVVFVDDHLEADGALINPWEDLNEDGQPVPIWFDWPEIEPEAVELVTWEPAAVPGLLQIPDTPVRSLTRRKSWKLAWPPGHTHPHRSAARAIHCAPGEQVVDSEVGNPEVMREQLEHLLAAAGLPNIAIQLVRFNGRLVALGGAFVLATMRDRTEASYLDTTIRGITTDDESDLARLAVKLRQLRAKALPEEMSLEVMRKALER